MQLESLLSVPRGTLEKLRAYEALLVKWQRAINLVGPASMPDAWTRHFIDSIQLASFIPEGARTLHDLGSGAGFPGLVLAMARPDLSVTLIESDQKKCAFLTNVSHETKTPVAVLTQRIEHATDSIPAPDVVSARALAGLEMLLDYVWPWAQKNPEMLCIFPKGAQAAAEILSAREKWTFTVVEEKSMTDPSATILMITNLSKKETPSKKD